ncbi:reverse transcriptase domain-containing protein [Tanacetum coccineum]
MIGNRVVFEVAKSPREERNIGDQIVVMVVTLEMEAKQLKGEMVSEAKRSLDRSSEESGEVFPGEAGERKIVGEARGKIVGCYRGVFKRLGSRGRSVSACSDSRNQPSYSWYTDALSESEDSGGGHLKSRSKKKKPSREEDDLSQPWFDDLPAESIDSYDDLKKAFLENYLQQKKCIKDPIVLHNIKQWDGESTEDFVRRYKLESKDIKGAPECMRISRFVHGITNPELIKRLHDKIPKTVDEMMRVTTSFLRGEMAASNHERKKSFPPWKQQESGHRQNFKKGGFRNQQRPERKQDRFTLLTKTPKEIFALEKGKFKTPPPMTTPVEKRNHAKFCEFHGEVGHTTDECMHLKKQIEEMLKEGKLSHLIKEIKQNSGKEQPKAVKKGETSRKDKALTILMVQPWERVAMKKITQSFSRNLEIFFPPLGEDEETEGPIIIEAKIGGHCIHRMYVDGGSASEILCEHCFSRLHPEIKNQLVPATTPMIGFSGEIIWPIGQIQLLVTIGDEEHSASTLMNFVVVRSPSPYNGIIGRPGVRKLQVVPSIVHRMLKILVEGGVITIKSSRRSQQVMRPAPTKLRYFRLEACGHDWRPKAYCRVPFECAEGMFLVHYHDWLSNPMMVKKHDDSWRMCVDFKDLNKACPKDGYPLPEIDWKVESLCGFPFKCFLDAYKGYHQIQMAKEYEEKTAFITSQGIFCYTKVPFGLGNARASYQRLVDKAFHKQIGRNLEVYVDDLVIKSCTADEIVRDMEETFKTLREINMKLNPKKCTFGRGVQKEPLITGQNRAETSHPETTVEADEAFKKNEAAYRRTSHVSRTNRKGRAHRISGSSKRDVPKEIFPSTSHHSNHGPADTTGVVKTKSSREAIEMEH